MERNFKNKWISWSWKVQSLTWKKFLSGLNNRFNRFELVEERISELEGKSVETTQSEEPKEKKSFNEPSLREMWDTIKHINICITEVQEGEEREKRKDKI